MPDKYWRYSDGRGTTTVSAYVSLHRLNIPPKCNAGKSLPAALVHFSGRNQKCMWEEHASDSVNLDAQPTWCENTIHVSIQRVSFLTPPTLTGIVFIINTLVMYVLGTRVEFG